MSSRLSEDETAELLAKMNKLQKFPFTQNKQLFDGCHLQEEMKTSVQIVKLCSKITLQGSKSHNEKC